MKTLNWEGHVRVEGNAVIVESSNGSAAITEFTTPEDASKAVAFSRQCQRVGVRLLVDREIVIRKIPRAI